MHVRVYILGSIGLYLEGSCSGWQARVVAALQLAMSSMLQAARPGLGCLWQLAGAGCRVLHFVGAALLQPCRGWQQRQACG